MRAAFSVLLFRALLAGAVPGGVAAVAPAAAQDLPVVFVHGISSSDLTWTDVAVALRDDGFGEPMSVHVDLNASAATDAASDVVWSEFVPLVRFGGTGQVARRQGPPPALGLGSRQFYVDFQAWADGATLTVHADRGAEGRSESNESGIVKQGRALALVIADVLAATGAERVVLVGHSMGGLAIREYLQRRGPDGTPTWWLDPAAEGGHRVAAAVTYGTPHQGSNLNDLGTGIGGSAVADPRSEAVRDLRYSYPRSALGPGRYLYGGDEVATDEFYSFDVTADGDEDDAVVGINAGVPAEEYASDNPAMPLPRDVRYVWVVGDVGGLGGDGVVDADRQVLRRPGDDGVEVLLPEGLTRRVVTNRTHVQQTNDVATIRSVLAGLATPADPAPAPVASLSSAPNPVRSEAVVTLELARPSAVRLSVVDVLGREVAVLAADPRAAGVLRLPWSAAGLAPGAYRLVLAADGLRQSLGVSVVR